jgi:DNA polymerase III delta prime subunit
MGLFPKSASNKFAIFPFVITISIVGILAAGCCTYFITSGDKISTAIFTVIVAVFILLFLWITKEIWMESKSTFLIRMATAGIALTTIVAYTGWQQTIQDILSQYLHIPNLGNAVHPIIVFSFSAFVIFTINYFNRDNTAMGIHPDPIHKDIAEPDFLSRMKMVTDALTDDLRAIDIKTNWSIQLFTPLDAEVELRSEGNEMKKKVTDLLKAIKSMKQERLFLVLGDPGSGKSVALRKLCRELAVEVEKTHKIPVYINLKEWQIDKKWDENNPPTVDQLNAFVLKNLKNRDIVTTKFFDKYYDRLYETGRLYFVFDSFDEIPSVLDEKDKSPLIQQLSNVMFKFLKGARQNSQGILSSRIFRRPTDDFQTRTTLEIRPFSDEKIEETLLRSNKFNADLIQKLFKERTDLVPVARNPFMTALLADYAENNKHDLPSNQSDLYESYIRNALKSCRDMIQKRGLTESGVLQCAIEMADIMFRDYGLEAPIKKLKSKLNIVELEDVIDVLEFARIGRVGAGEDNIFSFTHRRFCEYFAVQKLLQDNRPLDLNSIPEDSQWRDALVLYCEVAEENKSKKIANFCWDIIRSSNKEYDLRVIHSLRFLQDAFKGRLECIADFRDDLTKYLLYRINIHNIIITKLAVESLGLLKDDDIEKGVIQAFELKNEWINETTFKACRHLDNVNIATQNQVNKYISQLSVSYIINRYSEIKFSLKLSNSFKLAFKYCHLKLANFTVMLMILLVFIGLSFLHYDSKLSATIFILIFAIFLHYVNGKVSYGILINLCFTSLALALNSTNKFSIVENILFFSIPLLVFSLDRFYYFYLIMIRSNLKFVKLNSFFTISKWDKYLLLIFTTIIIIGVVLSYFFSYKYIISIMALLPIILLFYIEFDYMYRDFYHFKSLNYSHCSNRAYISKFYPKLNSRIFRQRFLLYLENNVRQATGEWEDPKILMLDNSAETIRLAKLEEKWLGLNK